MDHNYFFSQWINWNIFSPSYWPLMFAKHVYVCLNDKRRKWSCCFAKWINKMETNEQSWWITGLLSVLSAINHSSPNDRSPFNPLCCARQHAITLLGSRCGKNFPRVFPLPPLASLAAPTVLKSENAAGWLEWIRTSSESACVCAQKTVCEKRLWPMLNVSQLIKAPADSLTAAGALWLLIVLV